MRLRGKPANLGEDLSSFRQEVANEISNRENKLRKIQEHRSGGVLGHLISLGLISIMVFLIFQQYSVFILWLFIAILLYSYNFIILFVPTTTGIIRPDDKDVAPILIKERKWLALRLLLKNRKLAIEIGLTVILGGIVPLNLSFSIIFGVGLFFTLYFGFFAHIIADQTTIFIVIQIALVILFFIMILIIEPQVQGFTKIARSFKQKLNAARSKGRAAHLIVVLTMIGVISVAGVLVFGAMMLPGFLLPILFNDLKLFSVIDLPMIFLVFVIQLLVMRHFQVILSRWMAVKLLKERITELKKEVLARLNELVSLREGERKDAMLEDLKRKFYSIAIYDLVGHDIYGHFPVYLVGLRLRYLLDEDVIEHLKATTEKSQEIIKKSEDVQLTRERWTLSFKDTKEGYKAEIQSRASIKRKKE
jgi:hypothetical protein